MRTLFALRTTMATPLVYEALALGVKQVEIHHVGE
jgi:hypothetical protein